MNTSSRTMLVVAALLLMPALASAAQAVLRVRCSGEDVGAAVSVDGQFRGQCPLDISLQPRSVTVLVEKYEMLQERRFQATVRVAEGRVSVLQVAMTTRLTEAGRQAAASAALVAEANRATQDIRIPLTAEEKARGETMERCVDACSADHAPGAQKCIADARNWWGGTFSGNIPRRTECLKDAADRCYQACIHRALER